jgi:hypothetical protein
MKFLHACLLDYAEAEKLRLQSKNSVTRRHADDDARAYIGLN